MPEDGDSFSCKYCEKEFDSERGLHIHQSQVHPDEEKQEVADEESSEDEVNVSGSSEESGSESDDDGVFSDTGEDLDLEKTEEEFSVKPGKDDSTINISLTTRQVAGASLIVGLLLGGIISGIYFNLDTSAPPYKQNAVNVSTIDKTGEPIKGSADAPVTMVMYEDFQCPYCQLHSQRTQPKIVSNYVESGDLKLMWKDFPAPELGHDWAVTAATTMECVYREDNEAFWAVEKKIFDNQNSLTTQNARSSILDYAEQEGVNTTAVQNCIDSENPLNEVQGDREEGQSFDATVAGQSFVGGTPSFVIYGPESEKGTAVSGAVPYSLFKDLIENEIQN